MKKLILSVLAFVAFWGVAVAQDTHTDNHTVTIKVPNVGLLDIEPSASKNLTFDLSATGVVPTEAGNGFTWTSLTNNTLWLNISSVKSASKQRKIDVKASGLPAGINLNIKTATVVMTAGKGNLGTAQITTETPLTSTDQTLVNGIKTGYSGNGSGAGYQLTYSLTEPASAVYENLENNATGHVVTVTYTLVEY